MWGSPAGAVTIIDRNGIEIKMHYNDNTNHYRVDTVAKRASTDSFLDETKICSIK